jgi:ribosomal protein S18 acetylase RimI-like enzyme
MRTAWRRLTDKSEILAFLETDRLYAGYAIGDLEPGLFEHCEWFGADDAAPGDGRVRALVLCYHDFKPPVLFVMGDPDGVRDVVGQAPLPANVYLNCREEHLAAASPAFVWDRMTPMWRMALAASAFRPAAGQAAEVVELRASDAAEISGLFASGSGEAGGEAGGEAFRPGQMARGVYRGVRVGGQLVAIAGTHLVSQLFGIGAVGNVFTRPDCRGQGFGTAATSAVAAALLGRGLSDVILNVSQANTAAIRVYESLGFVRHCRFVEGPARAPGPDRTDLPRKPTHRR